MNRTKLFFVLVLLFPVVFFAQDFEWLPGGTYDPAIPTPKSVLGFEIGTYLTDHLQMVDYIHRLAESSERVQVFEFGETYEKRKMYLLAIGSPENMKKLEDIRTTIARLTDPRKTTPAEAESIAKETPPIGWINFGTDGNETSAFECSMQLAYQLAAGNDPLTMKILENVVTIINPVLSPDSHQWFATWAKAMTIGNPGTPDPAAAEHRSAWFVSTDGNHYLIDVNRDAFALTQAETQAMAKVLHYWNPQIWADNHGQPEEYFFAPFANPINLNYPPTTLKWATEVGKNIARYFDRFGWTYVKAERYDLYYPGYWDAYPSFSGAIGMTYETNGGGSKGFVYERSDGTLATLQESIHYHFMADMATLEVLADHREAMLVDYYNFRRTGMEEVAKEKFKQYVLPLGNDEGRTDSLVELLLRHQIEVYRAGESVSSERAQTYFDRESKPHDFSAGSYIVPLEQPQKRLLKSLFEPDPELEQKFLDEVNATRERNKQLGSDTPKEPLFFYDITAWSLPVTYGIEGAAFTEDIIALPNDWQVTAPPKPVGRVIGGTANYAYVVPYNDGGAKMAGLLLQEDYNVALAMRDFKNADRDFPAPSLVTRVERNPESLHERVRELAETIGIEVVAIQAGWAEEGISFGSIFMKNLKKPSIMVLTHQPTRATTFGSVYTLLDQRFGLQFSAVRTEHFAGSDLSRYNVIVMPDGSPAGYERLLGERGVGRLKNWIKEGGTLVAIRGGAAFTTREGIELTDVRLITEVPDPDAKPEEDEEEVMKPVENLPGSIFKATLTDGYYLGLGYADEIAVQVRGTYLFSRTEKGTNVATFPEASVIVGHKWEDTEAIMLDKPYLMDVPVGQGRVILFADDPTFRGFWRGLDRLVLSSILFAPAM
jgi:hypothetical protein